MAAHLKWSFWQASYDFKVFRLLEGDIRYMELLASTLFTSRESEIVRRSWTTWALLEETHGSGSQLNSTELISFPSVYSRPGRHVQLGTVVQLTHSCPLNAYLKSQPPCTKRRCGNQLDSSSALKVRPGIPVWWDALHCPWLFRDFTWKRIYLGFTLVTKSGLQGTLLPQNYNPATELQCL